jgi:hypothetical protein
MNGRCCFFFLCFFFFVGFDCWTIESVSLETLFLSSSLRYSHHETAAAGGNESKAAEIQAAQYWLDFKKILLFLMLLQTLITHTKKGGGTGVLQTLQKRINVRRHS